MTTYIPNALPLPTPAEMAAWDHAAIHDFGLRQDVLMECAGRAAFDVAENALGELEGLRALVLAGSGNNGGDAFVVARLLADAGARVLVLHTGAKRGYHGAAAANLRLAQRMGLALEYLPGHDLATLAAPLGSPDIIVDGLLGTGFEGELRPAAIEWIDALNRLGQDAFVLALDIPSGLNGLTGQPQPIAVFADATATFQAAKLGLALPGAEEYTGEIHVAPIGIPGFIMRQSPARCSLLTHGTALLAPLPARGMHKGQGGNVLVVGGSPGLTGAPLLAALGALRGGAGLATVACPAALAAEIKAGHPDVMTLPLGRGDAWTPAMAEDLRPRLADFDAVVLGPGLGRSEGTSDFLKVLLEVPTPSLVVDADALFWLAQRPELLAAPGMGAVLTPHPGEAARMAGSTIPDIQHNRIATARALAIRFGHAVALKGAGTVIAGANGNTWLSPFAVPTLAVAGSGDVLAGLIASLLARGLSTIEAACLGVYWHGLAGEMLESRRPLRGSLASEIADALPEALPAVLLQPTEDYPDA